MDHLESEYNDKLVRTNIWIVNYAAPVQERLCYSLLSKKKENNKQKKRKQYTKKKKALLKTNMPLRDITVTKYIWPHVVALSVFLERVCAGQHIVIS